VAQTSWLQLSPDPVGIFGGRNWVVWEGNGNEREKGGAVEGGSGVRPHLKMLGPSLMDTLNGFSSSAEVISLCYCCRNAVSYGSPVE